MRYAHEQPPALIEPFDRLGEHLYNLTHSSDNPGLDGTLPLGQDLAGRLHAVAVQMADSLPPSERRIINTWAKEWEAASGQIARLSVETNRRESRIFMAGPRDCVTDAAPALEYGVSYLHTRTKIPLAVRIHSGFTKQTFKRGALDRVDFDLSAMDLQRLQQNNRKIVPAAHIALAGLTHRVSEITLAAQDPLKAACPRIYNNIMKSNAQKALVRVASYKSTSNQESFMEVSIMDVDPVRYGPNRYLAVIRDPRHGKKASVLIFTNDEWDAFLRGIKANEFNV